VRTVLAAAVLGAAIVIAFVRVLGASDEPPPPIATATATPATTPTATPVDPLLAYVRSRLRGCRLIASGRARCTLPGGYDARFSRFRTGRALRAYFRTLRRGRPARIGSCAPDGRWWKADTPKTVEGKLIGRRVGRRLVLAWTDDDDRVAAFATATPKRAKQLCRAWEKYA
jgi:hypothetical protein